MEQTLAYSENIVILRKRNPQTGYVWRPKQLESIFYVCVIYPNQSEWLGLFPCDLSYTMAPWNHSHSFNPSYKKNDSEFSQSAFSPVFEPSSYYVCPVSQFLAS